MILYIFSRGGFQVNWDFTSGLFKTTRPQMPNGSPRIQQQLQGSIATMQCHGRTETLESQHFDCAEQHKSLDRRDDEVDGARHRAAHSFKEGTHFGRHIWRQVRLIQGTAANQGENSAEEIIGHA